MDFGSKGRGHFSELSNSERLEVIKQDIFRASNSSL